VGFIAGDEVGARGRTGKVGTQAVEGELQGMAMTMAAIMGELPARKPPDRLPAIPPCAPLA
jgi:hypothetical protein